MVLTVVPTDGSDPVLASVPLTLTATVTYDGAVYTAAPPVDADVLWRAERKAETFSPYLMPAAGTLGTEKLLAGVRRLKQWIVRPKATLPMHRSLWLIHNVLHR